MSPNCPKCLVSRWHTEDIYLYVLMFSLWRISNQLMHEVWQLFLYSVASQACSVAANSMLQFCYNVYCLLVFCYNYKLCLLIVQDGHKLLFIIVLFTQCNLMGNLILQVIFAASLVDICYSCNTNNITLFVWVVEARAHGHKNVGIFNAHQKA